MVNKTTQLYQYLASGQEISTDTARKVLGIEALQNAIERLKLYTSRKIREFYRTSGDKRVRWYVMEIH